MPSTPFPGGFLAKLYKNPDLYPIIPLVEMIYSRDSTVYHFDPKDASLLHDTVHSRTGVRHRDPLGAVCSTWRLAPPYGRLENGARNLAAIQAFSDDGKILIKTHVVSTVITVATEELGKVIRRFNQLNLRVWYLRVWPMNLLR
jgi:hypothetical protein